MAQFWSKAAVVNDCVIVDTKLAIPEQLRSAILAGLRDDVCRVYLVAFPESLNHQSENCRECTFFVKNLKSTLKSDSSKPLPDLSAFNQEFQLDFAGPIVDEKKRESPYSSRN